LAKTSRFRLPVVRKICSPSSAALAAAEALKHSIEGDAALVSAAEVSALAFGGASGEVKR